MVDHKSLIHRSPNIIVNPKVETYEREFQLMLEKEIPSRECR
jgi:hypothetical protein